MPIMQCQSTIKRLKDIDFRQISVKQQGCCAGFKYAQIKSSSDIYFILFSNKYHPFVIEKLKAGIVHKRLLHFANHYGIYYSRTVNHGISVNTDFKLICQSKENEKAFLKYWSSPLGFSQDGLLLPGGINSL